MALAPSHALHSGRVVAPVVTRAMARARDEVDRLLVRPSSPVRLLVLVFMIFSLTSRTSSSSVLRVV